jgi:hypothetical protein
MTICKPSGILESSRPRVIRFQVTWVEAETLAATTTSPLPEVADGTTRAAVKEGGGRSLSRSLPLSKVGGSGIPRSRWLEPVWCVELSRWEGCR